MGCTSPEIDSSACDYILFVADGRFHLESAMIRNPALRAFRYDPYSKTLSRESYHTEKMKFDRWLLLDGHCPILALTS